MNYWAGRAMSGLARLLGPAQNFAALILLGLACGPPYLSLSLRPFGPVERRKGGSNLGGCFFVLTRKGPKRAKPAQRPSDGRQCRAAADLAGEARAGPSE